MSRQPLLTALPSAPAAASSSAPFAISSSAAQSYSADAHEVYQTAVKMLFGLKPMPCNAGTAVQLLATAANQHNHADAMALLSFCHIHGIGTPVNYSVSLKLAIRSTHLNSPLGWHVLARHFEFGKMKGASWRDYLRFSPDECRSACRLWSCSEF